MLQSTLKSPGRDERCILRGFHVTQQAQDIHRWFKISTKQGDGRGISRTVKRKSTLPNHIAVTGSEERIDTQVREKHDVLADVTLPLATLTRGFPKNFFRMLILRL